MPLSRNSISHHRPASSTPAPAPSSAARRRAHIQHQAAVHQDVARLAKRARLAPQVPAGVLNGIYRTLRPQPPSHVQHPRLHLLPVAPAAPAVEPGAVLVGLRALRGPVGAAPGGAGVREVDKALLACGGAGQRCSLGRARIGMCHLCRLPAVRLQHPGSCRPAGACRPGSRLFCCAPFTERWWLVGQNSAQLLSSLPWPEMTE
jgi:hypothetical protein